MAFDPSKPYVVIDPKTGKEERINPSDITWDEPVNHVNTQESLEYAPAALNHDNKGPAIGDQEVWAPLFLVVIVVMFVVIRRLIKRMNTKYKRAGLVVFVFGLVLFSVGYASSGYYYNFSDAVETVFNLDDVFDDRPSVFFGFWFAVAGAFMSILYDATIKKILDWVNAAESAAREQ